jgi:hypothetical protein
MRRSCQISTCSSGWLLTTSLGGGAVGWVGGWSVGLAGAPAAAGVVYERSGCAAPCPHQTGPHLISSCTGWAQTQVQRSSDMEPTAWICGGRWRVWGCGAMRKTRTSCRHHTPLHHLQPHHTPSPSPPPTHLVLRQVEKVLVPLERVDQPRSELQPLDVGGDVAPLAARVGAERGAARVGQGRVQQPGRGRRAFWEGGGRVGRGGGVGGGGVEGQGAWSSQQQAASLPTCSPPQWRRGPEAPPPALRC